MILTLTSEEDYSDTDNGTDFLDCSILFGIGFVIYCISMCYTQNRKSNGIKKATETVCNYFQFNLNEKYQKTNGIGFDIIESIFATVNTDDADTDTYYHISVKPVDMNDNDAIIMVDESLVPEPAANNINDGDDRIETNY